MGESSGGEGDSGRWELGRANRQTRTVDAKEAPLLSSRFWMYPTRRVGSTGPCGAVCWGTPAWARTWTGNDRRGAHCALCSKGWVFPEVLDWTVDCKSLARNSMLGKGEKKRQATVGSAEAAMMQDQKHLFLLLRLSKS